MISVVSIVFCQQSKPMSGKWINVTNELELISFIMQMRWNFTVGEKEFKTKNVLSMALLELRPSSFYFPTLYISLYNKSFLQPIQMDPTAIITLSSHPLMFCMISKQIRVNLLKIFLTAWIGWNTINFHSLNA